MSERGAEKGRYEPFDAQRAWLVLSPEDKARFKVLVDALCSESWAGRWDPRSTGNTRPQAEVITLAVLNGLAIEGYRIEKVPDA